MKYITFLLLIFILSSCKLVVHRLVFNSKLLPNYASDKKINKFYEKNAVTTSNYIIFSDSNLVKKIKEPGWAFENWYLYNSDGYQIRRKGDSLNCITSDFNFFKRFELETMGYIDSTSQFYHDTVLYSKLYGNGQDSTQFNKPYSSFDYTLILYWSSWRGRYSSHILKLEREFVLNNPELSIQVIKVNMDFRKEMKNTGLNKLLITAEEVKQNNTGNHK